MIEPVGPDCVRPIEGDPSVDGFGPTKGAATFISRHISRGRPHSPPSSIGR